MRIIGIALALVVAIVSPSLAFAKDEAVPKEARAKGMADTPALIQAAGSDCQLADARFVGQATDPKTHVKTSLYEAACTGSEGLLIQEVSGQTTPGVFTCMEAAGAAATGNKGATQCILPGNADPKAGIVPFVTKANVPCGLDKVRALGHSATNVFFEIACHEGGGYILQLSAPPRLDKPISAQPCIMFDPSSNIHCDLTDRAAQLAVVDRLTAASGKPCTIKDRGFMGVAQSGMSYWEVSCQDGKGYVLEQKADSSFSRVIPCVDADAIAGGCKLSDSRQAKTDQNSLYSQLAKKAGFDCEVSGYAPFDVNMPGKEVVELVCSNRPDGAIAVFPVTGGAGEVYDCAHAELKSFRCTLSKPDTAYPKLTADLKAMGKNSCVVSASRVVGVSAEGKGYIEVACSDGLPGYMIEYNLSPISPKSPLVCAEAKGISGGCTLPGNKKS